MGLLLSFLQWRILYVLSFFSNRIDGLETSRIGHSNKKYTKTNSPLHTHHMNELLNQLLYLSSPFTLCSTISKCSLFIFSFSSTNSLSHKSYLLSSPSFLVVFIHHSPAFLILSRSRSPSTKLLSNYSVFILSFSFLRRCYLLIT